MSFLATIRSTPNTGAVIKYTLPFVTGTDTTNILTPGTPSNFNLYTYLRNNNIIKRTTGRIRAVITLPAGITIGSSLVSRPAMVLSGVPSNIKITLINNGTIIGCGGSGGIGSYGNTGTSTTTGRGGSGGAGGDALSLSSPLSLVNNGIIGGGGGGGGAGGGFYQYSTYQYTVYQNCQVNYCGCNNGSSACQNLGCYRSQCCQNNSGCYGYAGGQQVDSCCCCCQCQCQKTYACNYTATGDNSYYGAGGTGGPGKGFNNYLTWTGAGSAGTIITRSVPGGTGGSGGNYSSVGLVGTASTWIAGTYGAAGNAIVGSSFLV